MAKNTSIILGAFYDDIIKEELSKGKYATASEIIREGLRLVYERNLKISSLNKALDEGEQSGEAVLYDSNDLIKKMTKKRVYR